MALLGSGVGRFIGLDLDPSFPLHRLHRLLMQVQVLDHLHGVFGVDCSEWYTGQMLGIAIRKSRNTKRCPMLVPGTRVPE